MTSEDIRDIRKTLGLTQEELAQTLGVTKTTIARYEMQNGPKPQGDAERKLIQLQTFLEDPEQRSKICEIMSAGGIASLAGILAVGSALFPVSATAIRGITLGAILATPAIAAIGALFKHIKKN